MPPVKSRVHAIDFMRLFVVVAVVVNHVISYVTTSPLVGAVWTVTHIGREVFLMISAFVLVYVYGRRPNMNWRQFFKRRYILITVPYATWTVIYAIFYDHVPLDPGTFLPVLGHYLITGRACYHLYFLLLLMQFYPLAPLLIKLLRRTEAYHVFMLVVAGVIQAGINLMIQWTSTGPGLIGYWLHRPDPWLGTYLFYVLAGAIGAWHAPRIIAFADRHLRLILGLLCGSIVIGLLAYALNLQIGADVKQASITFQPATILQSLTVALTLLAVGRLWERRGMRARRVIEIGSVVSFGVYLAHPLILQIFLDLLHLTGGLEAYGALPIPAALLAALLIGVPVVLIFTTLPVALLRRTPLALPLIGRL